MATFYQILGVSQTATVEEIRKAFRSKAKLVHPDVNSSEGAKQQFQKINEAYQTLQNDHKRIEYDQRLRTGNFSQKIYYRPSASKRASYQKYRQYHRHRSSGSGFSSNYKRDFRNNDKEAESSAWKKAEKGFEIFGFSTLLIAGIFAISRSVYRLIYPVKEVDPYPGLIGGTVFSVILIYFWVMKNKTYDP